MPYRGSSYNFVIDSSFQPFSMEELLTPLMMYKDVYEKQEAAFDDLADKSNQFKYLSETLPEGSKARQIYEGYANDLSQQAQDLATNGLSINSRRALTNLKRRYQGEIGRLVTADEALRKERELRRTMNTKDSSMLYANDNLSIDDFLDSSTPNLYNISGTELYTRGAAAGKAASSRVYNAGDEGSTLNGYYRRWVERNGYSKESMNAFRANVSAIPELQQAAEDILAERGALDNLTGDNLERARQSVINGIIDGAIYKEDVNLVRDEGVMSAAAREQYNLQREQMTKSAAQSGLVWDDSTNSWKYDLEKDPTYQRQKSLAEKKQEIKNTSGSSGSGKLTERDVLLNKGVRVKWNGDTPNDINDDDDDIDIEELGTEDNERAGLPMTYDQLPTYARNKVDAIIGDRGDVDHYVYYFRGYKSGTFWDDNAKLEIVPRKIVVDNSNTGNLGDMFSDSDLE